jgi:hypothetical protein
MCGGTAWTLQGWQPFAAIERAADVSLGFDDADAPLTRERPRSVPAVSIFPGVPLS